mmetsp:Transcript_28848/g.63185  ORF Transcript_28848/g.63185 Transcript_28848/m.63185 type:complete len:326 (+) Transcript_28848:790-1767(+)
MSMSSTLSPTCLRTAGMATAGPTPMISGGQPATAKPRNTPTTGRRCLAAKERRASSTHAAPSVIWLALPAVVEPSFLKAGLSLPSASAVIPARMPSSARTVTFVIPPSLPFTFVVTGTISESKYPMLCAFTAFACDSAAIWSCTCRGMPHFAATFSDVIPIGMRHFLASACSNTFSLIKEVSIEFAMSAMDIVSTPPASPQSYSPALIAFATVAIACNPLEHCLLMPCKGTLYGIPAVACACRKKIGPCCISTFPITMSPIRDGSTFERSTAAFMAVDSITSGGVSLNMPRLALQRGVRTAQQITTSSSDTGNCFAEVLCTSKRG